MGKVIIVTGTPGTGKTTVARGLAKAIGARHLNLTQYISKHKLYTGIDQERRTKIIDVERTRNSLKRELRTISGLVIVDTHMPDEVIPKETVSQVFVLRCHPTILERRLRAKRWRTSKIRENVLAEIIDSCLIEAIKRYGLRKVIELDATRASVKKITASAERSIIGKPLKSRIKTDWLTKLEKEGMLERYLKR